MINKQKLESKIKTNKEVQTHTAPAPVGTQTHPHPNNFYLLSCLCHITWARHCLAGATWALVQKAQQELH